MTMTSTDAAASQDSENHLLDSVFCPKSVAVLGVTPTPGTVPYDIFYNILSSGYCGTVYPVAPGKRSICAVKAYRYVLDIEDDVDQAVIVYPANVVERALEQCGRKGIKSAIVISAGFREVGPEGIKKEQRLKDICAEYGIAMIGPNCLGVINTDPKVRLNASFARKMPDAGRIAFLSQSGALCTAVLDYAREKSIGFSKFVSFGNKAGVTEIELFDYLHKDPDTDIILLYLEELRNGRALMEAARRVTRGEGAKPILAIKSGRRLREVLDGAKPLDPGVEKYLAKYGQGSLLIVNIESTPAMVHLTELVNSPGLDAVFIGPHDLSVSLGVPEEYRHPELQGAVKQIISACRKAKVGVGIHLGLADAIDFQIQWAKLGANILIHQSDLTLFLHALRSDFRKFHQETGRRPPTA